MNLYSKILISALAATVSTSAVAGVVSDVGSVPDHSPEKGDKDWSGMIGLVALSAPEYWSGDDTETTAAPVIVVDYKDKAYFKVNRGGFWFWKPNDNFRVGALAKIRPGAWEDDDDEIEDLTLPADFDEPDPQVEPGVNFLYKRDRFSAEAQLTSGEDTNVAVSFGYNLMQSSKGLLTLRLEVETLGEDTVNYNWYGDRSAADPDSATNTSIALIGIYNLNPEWKLLYGVKGTSLDDEIEDSPIGNEDSYNIGFVGAAWSF